MFGLGAFQSLAAQDLLYHFSGTVSQIETDAAGIIAARGLAVGSPVELTYRLNFGRPGTITHYDGSVEAFADIPGPGEMGNLSVHFFHADLVGGTFVWDEAAEQLRPPNGQLERNWGATIRAASAITGTLVGGGVNYYVDVHRENPGGGMSWPPPLPWGYTNEDPSVDLWQVGDEVLSFSSASDAESRVSAYRAELVLERITAVPEPPPAHLIVAGVLAMAAGRRRCG